MKETELIKKYFLPICKNFKPSLNLEDDGAILKNFYKENFVISVDNFIQGIHCPSFLDPKLTIIRAILCSTSDLAAMGAAPYCMFLSLAIPRKKKKNFFIKISQGIQHASKIVGISLAGGDLTSYDGPFSISVTVIGKKRKSNKTLFRNGSREGDYIGVTGFIGDAFIGLKVLEKKIKISNLKHQKAAINSFLFPPQLHKFADHLSMSGKCCIDISDGLIEDIKKLGDLANCGISLFSNKIPTSDYGKILINKGNYTLKDYLTAGDDYQLAFTFEKKNSNKIKALEKKCNIKISVIGKLTKKRGVFLDNKIISGGFSHF